LGLKYSISTLVFNSHVENTFSKIITQRIFTYKSFSCNSQHAQIKEHLNVIAA